VAGWFDGRSQSPEHFVMTVSAAPITGFVEGWSLGDAVYFTFITGRTIGYGDLVPRLDDKLRAGSLATDQGKLGAIVICCFGVRCVFYAQTAA
jgi:hypothetical protein